ncbi:hypothetical protein KRMM14A1004_24830 [Krasilnikovia sp. MM14-A1004]
MKSNGSPQDGQNPAVRPGRSPRARPTGLPHLAQYRLSSGTCATAITAVDGSRWGSGATSTRPPPKRRRRLPLVLPLRPDPPVRVDNDTAPVRTDGAVAVRCAGGAALLTAVVAGAVAGGAMPQVSQ